MHELRKKVSKNISDYFFEINNKELSEINMAPIIIFAYNRADMIKRLLECLEKNECIDKMELFIFVDVPSKNNLRDIRYNKDVIDFVNNYKMMCKKFKNIQIEMADKHKGLANSIISGVTKIINQYEKAIILEDDLEVSCDFLDYMQRGLEAYKYDERIWSIAGYLPMFNLPLSYKEDVFLALRPESWGWGTWKNRWNRCDWQVKSYKRFQKDIFAQLIFNLGGNDLGLMLKLQMNNPEYNSWAVRWGYHQFLERKYTIYPKESRVIHCGTDNRSTHNAVIDKQKLKNHYEKCQFAHLKLRWNVIWKFKKIYDIPFMQLLKRYCEKYCFVFSKV